MSTNQYHCLRELRPNSYNWKIKVRIIRLWRGVSKNGEEFKGLNMLLLDDKNGRMHAFVPGTVIEKHEGKLCLGTICIIQNFSVKDYKTEEKFRCVKNERQIILTTYTTVSTMDENDLLIANNLFDFSDLQDLDQVANQNVYLTDVVGVIQKDFPLRNVKTKFNDQQLQVKFTIVDGRCSVNVTFWDSLAADFAIALEQITDFPAIIIIASGKITSWQGTNHTTPQIDISNAAATKFYINYDHHVVSQLRRMLSTPIFSKYDFSSQMPENVDTLEVKDIKNLGYDYVQKEVIAEVQLTCSNNLQKWFEYACSSCYQTIDLVDTMFACYRCNNRDVPHPQKKFHIEVEAEDKTGTIVISLFDREVRTLIGKTAQEIVDETPKDQTFPERLNNLQNIFCMVKLRIRKSNVEKKSNSYHATNISLGSEDEEEKQSIELTEDNMQESQSQASASTFHLDDFSQLNFITPDVNQEKKKKKRTPKPNKKFL
ncbi:hypothetical protein POM88_040648 [Heracleum sosnowskyi]|uniref:Uncharacterized protein n=1 Tax=Heracleum sosnowskyi TaxID=360622 RepID=A0AAD8MA22_9APIA|nr:hypothetical protein POM88_040648 [Heracleum sosnowskyi]